MDKLLQELRSKVDQAEVYRISGRTVPVNFRSGKLESIKSHEIEGIALRVIVDGRLGFATTTNLTDHAELIAAAISSAKFGEQADFSFVSEGEPVHVEVYDRETADVPEEKLIDIGFCAIAEINDADPEAEVSFSISKQENAISVANTLGIEREERRTSISVSIELNKAKPGDIFTMFDGTQARYFVDIDIDELVNRLIRYLEYGNRVVKIDSKPMPVVFTHNGVVAILLPLFYGFNGKSVYMGTSPLKGRIGELAFDPRISMLDDGTLPRGPRSSGFDDEGSPTTRTTLISSGVIEGFVYDRRTAALAGTTSTGNGYKGGPFSGGFRSPPSVGMSNVLLEPGDIPGEELIAGIDEGLLVDSVLGLGQGNINSGEFSNNVAVAFKIERGKIVGRVKNTMIAGNSYDLLKDHLIGLSKETRFVHGILSTPMIVVDKVNVVGEG